jgi:hypothetical protein
MRRFAILLLLAFLFACSSGSRDKTKEYKTQDQLAAEDRKFEECRTKLKKANELSLLYNMDIIEGRPLVVVGPTFYRIPFDAKEVFAETVNCFLVAGTNKLAEFELLDYRTHKVVAVYHWGKLEMK